MAAGGSGSGIGWEWVAPGAAAHRRLGEVLDDLKGGDPLAAVSVVVPANPAGVWARRALAARPTGVVGVRFCTLAELAADLAAARLGAAGSLPLADQELLALVRVELARTDGAFHPVRHHASTQRVVADAIAALGRVPGLVDDAGGGRLRPLARQAAALGARIRTRPGFHDEVDVLAAAQAAAEGGGGSIGPIVVFQPEWLGVHERAFLVALATAGVEVRVLSAATGDPRADGVALSLAAELGVEAGAPPEGRLGPDPEVIEAADPETEVRHAVAWLVERHREGVAWDELSLGYAAAVPYARLVEATLDAAGVPWNGPSTTTIGSTAVGRLVASMFRVLETGYARRAVIAALRCLAPARKGWPLSSWDRCSRRAGVVAGIEQWRERLDAAAAGADADAAEAATEGERERHRTRAEQTRQLRYVVDELFALAEPLREPESWADAVVAVGEWLSRLDPAMLDAPDQRIAAETFGAALDGLSGLGAIEPDPRPAAIREALTAEMDRRVGRHGRIGRGLLAGPLPALSGAAPRAVALVGLSEGVAPRRLRPTAILSRSEMAGVEADLGLDTELLQLRRFRCLVVAASERVLLSCPAVDPRSARRLTPSRWLLEDGSLSADARRADLVVVPSLWSDAARRVPLTRAELTHAALRSRPDQPARSAWLTADGLALASDIIDGRRSGLSAWSGLVGSHDTLDVARKVHSASAFEAFAACPTKYLYRHVLGIGNEEEPEDVEGIDPRGRGELVHLILQRWVDARMIAGDGELHVGLLGNAMRDAFEEWENAHGVGRAEVWRRDKDDIAARLDAYASLEGESVGGWTPCATELAFGDEGSFGVATTVGEVRFRGRVDRVDVRPNGELRVVDYKVTGRAQAKLSIDEATVRRGVRLQLPLYGRAAAANLGGSTAVAEYWESARGQTRACGVDLGDVDDAFTAAVGDVAEAIGAGVFPLQPGEETTWPRSSFANCRYCDFDSVCPTQRAALAESALLDPAAAPIVRRLDAAAALGGEG